jgi:hypothetical protein
MPLSAAERDCGADAPGIEPQRPGRERGTHRTRKREPVAGTPAALSRLPLGIYNLAWNLQLVKITVHIFRALSVAVFAQNPRKTVEIRRVTNPAYVLGVPILQ